MSEESSTMDVGVIILVERDCQDWIEAVTGSYFEKDSFRESLQDGIILCRLLNEIRQGSVKKINTRPGPFANMENLNAFLDACKRLGIPPAALFSPSDLQAPPGATKAGLKRRQSQLEAQRRQDDKNMRNVLITLYWLNQKAVNLPGYCGPKLVVDNFSQLMKDPWASPAKSLASRPQKPPLPGVCVDSLNENDVTGLRRASMATSTMSSSRPRSPSPINSNFDERPNGLPLQMTSTGSLPRALSASSTSSYCSASSPTSSTSSVPSQLQAGQSPYTRQSPAFSSPAPAPLVKKLSTGGQITLSVSQQSERVIEEQAEQYIDSVELMQEPVFIDMPESYQLSENLSSSSLQRASYYRPPDAVYSKPDEEPEPRDHQRHLSSRASEGSVAFLVSPIKMTVMSFSDGDSDTSQSEIPPPLSPPSTAYHTTSGSTGAAPTFSSQAPHELSSPYRSTVQDYPEVSLFPTPPPDSSQSPSPDVISVMEPARPRFEPERVQEPVMQAQVYSSRPQGSFQFCLPEEPNAVEIRQPPKPQHFAPATAARSEALYHSPPMPQANSSHTTSSRSGGKGSTAPAATPQQQPFTGHGSTDSRSSEPHAKPHGPPPPPQRDAAAESKRHQIYAAHGWPGRSAAVAEPSTVASHGSVGEPFAPATSSVSPTQHQLEDMRSELFADLTEFAAQKSEPAPAQKTAPAVAKKQGPAPAPKPKSQKPAQNPSSAPAYKPAPQKPAQTQAPVRERTVSTDWPSLEVAAPSATSAGIVVRKTNVGKSMSFNSGSDVQRLVAEEQQWRATRRRSELAKQVDLLLDDTLLKNLSKPMSMSTSSHDGSESFLDAAASDARQQEKQRLKLLQDRASHQDHGIQRPASASGYLPSTGHSPHSAHNRPGGPANDSSLLATSEHASPRARTPGSPFDVSTGIDKDKSEMERLLALAQLERSQQLEMADEHRRMSLSQKAELVKREREKAVRNMHEERRRREEQDRLRKWREIEEERKRQMQEEEEEETRRFNGGVAAARSGGIQGSMTSPEVDDCAADSIDPALAQQIEDEPIWEILPARETSVAMVEHSHGRVQQPEAEKVHEVKDIERELHSWQNDVDVDMQERREDIMDDENTEEGNVENVNLGAGGDVGSVFRQTSAFSQSSEEDTTVLEAVTVAAESPRLPMNRRSNSSRTSLIAILDPLSSAIEMLESTQPGKRRSITPWTGSDAPLFSPKDLFRNQAAKMDGGSAPLKKPAQSPSTTRTSTSSMRSPLASVSSLTSTNLAPSPSSTHTYSSLGSVPMPAKPMQYYPNTVHTPGSSSPSSAASVPDGSSVLHGVRSDTKLHRPKGGAIAPGAPSTTSMAQRPLPSVPDETPPMKPPRPPSDVDTAPTPDLSPGMTPVFSNDMSKFFSAMPSTRGTGSSLLNGGDLENASVHLSESITDV